MLPGIPDQETRIMYLPRRHDHTPPAGYRTRSKLQIALPNRLPAARHVLSLLALLGRTPISPAANTISYRATQNSPTPPSLEANRSCIAPIARVIAEQTDLGLAPHLAGVAVAVLVLTTAPSAPSPRYYLPPLPPLLLFLHPRHPLILTPRFNLNIQ